MGRENVSRSSSEVVAVPLLHWDEHAGAVPHHGCHYSTHGLIGYTWGSVHRLSGFTGLFSKYFLLPFKHYV